MDTKWSNTDSAFLPSGGEEPLKKAESRTKRRARAAAGFLAFVLGVSLAAGSLGNLLGRWARERGSSEWWKSGWQDTAAFRSEVSAYLQEFLTLAAGEPLDWYASQVFQEVFYDHATEAVPSTPVLSYSETDDTSYQKDKNVLYQVRRQRAATTQTAWYSNTGGIDLRRDLPEGYNFLLTFSRGKVSIVKDGVDLDVYGDGIYSGGDQWFVPGYDNFQAGEGVEDVVVYMAVRKTPTLYYGGYRDAQINRMYYVYQSFQESREFYLRQGALLALGLLCLAVWYPIRREKRLADERIAVWTVHIWTEARFLAVAVWLTALLLPRAGSAAYDLWYLLQYEDLSVYTLPYCGRTLAACLESTPALLGLVWTLWLIHNDHRYHSRESRKSLLRKLYRALQARDLKRPIEKRLSRRAVVRPALLWIIVLLYLPCTMLVYRWTYHFAWSVLGVLLAGGVLSGTLQALWARQDRALARDLGLLADQVEAIRAGDLTTPLALPENGDLRQTAEALNDIQTGLHTALEEQTRSERMKVELVSNVSHDLKTPLTSILSYAELLRQEPLEGAAADYARIIDEKAQRLKLMVQDVFEISKAAANQLPVQPESLDLAKLLRQTLADMDGPIRESALTFKIDLPETPVMIVADGRRLYRVFQNLIQNALQYALEGSRVYLTLKVEAGRGEVSLRNISRMELRPDVDFTARFVRGEESRTDGGSGLGLSIASSFTEACGGTFRVETVADLFTAVVSFPLANI